MNDKVLNVAIVGVGRRGTTLWKSIETLPDVRVVALVDKKRPSVLYGLPHFTNVEGLFHVTKPDAVLVAVPIEQHVPITRYCLEHDAHVLVEKPIASTAKEGGQLVSIAKRKKKLLIVGYQLLFEPWVAKTRGILSSGELGDILSVRARQSHDWGGSRPHDWLLAKNGGGTLIDNASHYVALLESLVGRVNEVSCMTASHFWEPVEDTAILTMRFQTDVLGTIETSWGDRRGKTNQLTIWGTKAVLEFLEHSEFKKLSVENYDLGSNEWSCRTSRSFYIPNGIDQIQKSDYMSRNPESLLDGTTRMLSYFIQCVRDKQTLMRDVRCVDPVRVSRVVEAGYRSALTKRIVRI